MSTFSIGNTYKHESWNAGHARKVFREIRHKFPAGGVVTNVAAWLSANKKVIPAGTPVTFNAATKQITALLSVAAGAEGVATVNGLLQEDIYLEGVSNAADITVTGTVVYAGEIYEFMLDSTAYSIASLKAALPQMAFVN